MSWRQDSRFVRLSSVIVEIVVVIKPSKASSEKESKYTNRLRKVRFNADGEETVQWVSAGNAR